MSILRSPAFYLLSSLSLAALPLAACQPAVAPPSAATAAKAPGATLVVTLDRGAEAPKVLHATHPYDWYDVDHVVIELYAVGPSSQTLVDSIDLDGDEAEAPITFSGLAPHTTYRVRLKAYRLPGTDDKDLISVNGPGTDQEIRIENEEAPTFTRLRVRLREVPAVVATVFADGFSELSGLTVDASGVVYASDKTQHRIYRISPDGTSSTVIGTGYGPDDGPATSAQFAVPKGLVADAAGNVYVAESDYGRIRKISPTGEVSTYAGISGGDADATSTDAVNLGFPVDVALDGAGNLYVAAEHGDLYYYRIYKITPEGVVSTLAGADPGGGQEEQTAYRVQSVDGPGNQAEFQEIAGLEADAAGNLYVVENGEVSQVRYVRASDGFVTTLMSNRDTYLSGNASVPEGSLHLPYVNAVTLDANGDLFLGTSDGLLRRDRSGMVRKVKGYDHEYGGPMSFYGAAGVAFTRHGPIYLIESGSTRILRLN